MLDHFARIVTLENLKSHPLLYTHNKTVSLNSKSWHSTPVVQNSGSVLELPLLKVVDVMTYM